MSKPAALLATLGAKPQVVAIAVQLLLDQGESLACVYVLHTDPYIEPVGSALAELIHTFSQHSQWPPLHLVHIPVTDVLDSEQLDKFALSLFQTIKRCLINGQTIHLLLAGGRKPMAMVGMSVAQVLLGTEDRVWYLHSDDELQRSGRWQLLPGDEARLVPIPLPSMRAAPAVLTQAFAASTPQEAYEVLTTEQVARRRVFVEQVLTPAERIVASLVAQDVLTVEEIARRLHKSPKTITNQLTQIYSKLESHFGLQPDVGVKREFLRQELAGYFKGNRG